MIRFCPDISQALMHHARFVCDRNKDDFIGFIIHLMRGCWIVGIGVFKMAAARNDKAEIGFVNVSFEPFARRER